MICKMDKIGIKGQVQVCLTYSECWENHGAQQGEAYSQVFLRELPGALESEARIKY